MRGLSGATARPGPSSLYQMEQASYQQPVYQLHIISCGDIIASVFWRANEPALTTEWYEPQINCVLSRNSSRLTLSWIHLTAQESLCQEISVHILRSNSQAVKIILCNVTGIYTYIRQTSCVLAIPCVLTTPLGQWQPELSMWLMSHQCEISTRPRSAEAAQCIGQWNERPQLDIENIYM